MKSFTFILTAAFILFFPGLLVSQEYYFKFSEENKERINTIVTRTVSIDKVEGTTVYAYANPAELEKIKALGYSLQMLPHPSSLPKAITMATTIAQMATWDKYPTYEVYRAMMKKWEQDYPTLCKLDSIGTTVDGRKLYVIKISDNVLVDEAEPEFFYTSTMHGDEATGYYLMLRMIDYLLSRYTTDSRVAEMVNNIAIYINPNANPDGTYYGGNSTVVNARRSNANGYDLNRNFPDPRVGQNPNGPYQPETIDMMNYAGSRNFILSANFHGGIELANYPWDAWTTAQNPHPDDNWFYTVSRQYADLAQANSPAGYFTGENNGVTQGGDWYVVSGGRQDYMNYWHHCREITFEVSDTKLIGSESLINHWNYNREALLTYLELVYYGFRGTVTNAGGQPLAATITIVGHDKDNSHVRTNPNHGNYYRMIAPGTYNVTYSAEGYISQVHSVVVNNSTSSVTKNVVLVQATQTTLTGQVTSVTSGSPIQGVKVELLGTSTTPVYTNSNGDYSFPSVSENSYQIKASKSGFISVIQTVEVTTSNNVVNFVLEESNAESFESNIPAGFTFAGGNWTRDNSTAFDGTYSMKSATIGNSAQTTMQITLNVATAGAISFAQKVSSESGYDFLKFYIDDVEKGSWSGNQDWVEVSYAVTTGNHTFKWVYSKDGSAVGGSDCAWVDNIIFPQSYQNVVFTVTANSIAVNGASISFNGMQQTTNASGQSTFTNVTRGNGKAYIVSKVGYLSASGNVDVLYTSVNKAVAITVSTTTHTLTFNVKHNETPINGAVVKVNGTEKATNAEGTTVFTGLTTASYNYEVSASGFVTVNGNVVLDSDKTLDIQMVPVTYTVTFSVLGVESTPITGATVTFNTSSLATNAQGEVQFSGVTPQQYSFTIEADGYATVSDNVTVSSDITIPIQLILLSSPWIDNSNLSVSVWPVPFSSLLNIELFTQVPSKVRIEVFSITGQKIVSLANLENVNGTITLEWNGESSSGELLPNGIYFIKAMVNGNGLTKKVLLHRAQ
jgi:hypothetical protein